MKSLRISLSAKLFWGFVVLLFPVIITFLAGYRSNKTHITSFALKDLAIMGDSYEGQVYQFLEMSRRRAQDFSSDGFIRDQLQKINQGNLREAVPLSHHLIWNKISMDKTINSIHIISLSGRIAASTNSLEIGRDVSKEPFYLKGKEGIAVSEGLTQPLRSPGLAISGPITDRVTGKTIGVLVNIILLTELDRVLNGDFYKELGALSTIKEKRKNLDVYVVNKEKRMIAGQHILSEKAFLSRTVDTPAVNDCLKSNKEGAGIERNFQGVDVAWASMCIPSLNWVLVVEVPEGDILAPVAMMKRQALIVGMVIVGLIGLLTALFMQTVVRPVDMVSETAQAIAGGDFNKRVYVRTGDEIEKLADSINNMALKIERSVSNMEEKVRQRTEELAKANDELKGLERLKTNFLQTISHELRSPLTPILGYLDMMREGGWDLAPHQMEVVHEMQICGRRMQLLIDELLEVVSIQGGDKVLDFKEVDIYSVLQNAVADVKKYAVEISTEIEVRIPEKNILVVGDRRGLSGIFAHLLRNALKFSKEGGKVTLGAYSVDNGVEVVVSDMGIGIPKEKLDKIFEAFYQVESSASRRYEGVGLGLYLVKRLIDLHNGAIRVESRKGEGATFRVFIPKDPGGGQVREVLNV